MIGRQLDRYRLIEEVGSGGMAVVYKGLDLALDREVAVKVMHPHLAGKEESRRRFSREARAVARLQHPGIVEIFDYSDDGAQESFIVTEYVKGRTLREFGEEVGFGIPEIGALIAERLAEALEHAHAAGVVHRDLKPENIMVREDGVLKLMDFGIARMIGQDERMTMTGAMVGSPLHMAPEVIEGRDAGRSADLFSLGTILYWLVTGTMAFQGKNTTQTLRQILETRYPDPRSLTPSCSDELAAVIARCLQRDPAARYESMAELRAVLREVLAAAGMEPGEEELRSFFADPAAYRRALQVRLVERLLAEGEAALRRKRTSRALALFDRVLALDPSDERAKLQLEQMRRSNLVRKRLRRVGGGAAALATIAIVAAVAYRDSGRAADAAPTPPVSSAPAGDDAPTTASDGDARPDDSPRDEVVPAPPAPEPSRPERAPPRGGAVASTNGGRPAAPADRRLVQLRWVPQGAILSIDGMRKDTVAPFWSGELPVGRHVITLTHPDCCVPLEERIVLERGAEPVQRSLVLAPRESGWFEVDADPEAEVWLDGSFRGTVGEINRRGGVAVGFSKDDSGQARYVKTVPFELLSPRGSYPRERLAGNVVVRAGQRTRTRRLDFPGQRSPEVVDDSLGRQERSP